MNYFREHVLGGNDPMFEIDQGGGPGEGGELGREGEGLPEGGRRREGEGPGEGGRPSEEGELGGGRREGGETPPEGGLGGEREEQRNDSPAAIRGDDHEEQRRREEQHKRLRTAMTGDDHEEQRRREEQHKRLRTTMRSEEQEPEELEEPEEQGGGRELEASKEADKESAEDDEEADAEEEAAALGDRAAREQELRRGQDQRDRGTASGGQGRRGGGQRHGRANTPQPYSPPANRNPVTPPSNLQPTNLAGNFSRARSYQNSRGSIFRFSSWFPWNNEHQSQQWQQQQQGQPQQQMGNWQEFQEYLQWKRQQQQQEEEEKEEEAQQGQLMERANEIANQRMQAERETSKNEIASLRQQLAAIQQPEPEGGQPQPMPAPERYSEEDLAMPFENRTLTKSSTFTEIRNDIKARVNDAEWTMLQGKAVGTISHLRLLKRATMCILVAHNKWPHPDTISNKILGGRGGARQNHSAHSYWELIFAKSIIGCVVGFMNNGLDPDTEEEEGRKKSLKFSEFTTHHCYSTRWNNVGLVITRYIFKSFQKNHHKVKLSSIWNMNIRKRCSSAICRLKTHAIWSNNAATRISPVVYDKHHNFCSGILLEQAFVLCMIVPDYLELALRNLNNEHTRGRCTYETATGNQINECTPAILTHYYNIGPLAKLR